MCERKQGQGKAAPRRLSSKASFRATSLLGTLGSWGHGRHTGKADLSALEDSRSLLLFRHQGLGEPQGQQ